MPTFDELSNLLRDCIATALRDDSRPENTSARYDKIYLNWNICTKMQTKAILRSREGAMTKNGAANGVAHGLTATVELHLHIDDRELCEELSGYAGGRERHDFAVSAMRKARSRFVRPRAA